MGLLGTAAEKIPGIPTKRSIGLRLATRGYSNYLGDADVVGHVVSPDGWELVRADHETDDEEEFYVPRDGTKRYPADGVGANPGTLFGTPITVGYRDFGSLREVPNTEIAREVHILESDDEDPNVDQTDPTLGERIGSYLPDVIGSRMPEWLTDSDERAQLQIRKGLALILGTKIVGSGASADALNLVRDSDGRWGLERVDYDVDIGWYESRDTGQPYSAEGIGGKPKDLLGTPVGYSLSKYPRMMAAVTPRLGRNMHEEKLADGGTTYGGGYYNQNGEVVVPDGGEVQAAANPTEVDARHNDIWVEERAFVLPEDAKLLGGNEETTDKIQTAKERVKASQNMPGGELADKIMRYSGMFLALIMGWWMGSQSGGNGGEAGSAVPTPVQMDITPMMDVMMGVM
ncbi:hypothetical protein [Natranaeroarchaeum sulfidigenes]|uniref:Uncharacterized protein n=1 Tax=Natranaeroarchaeum sulfidigenes TaxID=2784880 RepID=A0A897MQA5_9EURY|nr:hypothetical protein [Natranaeroarchaeum sulfidigenes]QSG02521.1 hypothetical protein AArcS_1304 [Natranaeroarchaeum sulfidigenes]